MTTVNIYRLLSHFPHIVYWSCVASVTVRINSGYCPIHNLEIDFCDRYAVSVVWEEWIFLVLSIWISVGHRPLLRPLDTGIIFQKTALLSQYSVVRPVKQKLQSASVTCKPAVLRTRARNYFTVGSKWTMSDSPKKKIERIESDPVRKAVLASAQEERQSYWRVWGSHGWRKWLLPPPLLYWSHECFHRCSISYYLNRFSESILIKSAIYLYIYIYIYLFIQKGWLRKMMVSRVKEEIYSLLWAENMYSIIRNVIELRISIHF
jgi:hypothetical protein